MRKDTENPPDAGWQEPKKSATPKSLIITAVVAFYFSVSLCLVFVNKGLLGDTGFPYPLLLTWFQLIIAMVIVVVTGIMGQVFGGAFNIFPPFEFDLGIAMKIAPLTVVYVSMIAFNNLCLQFVQVTFYQVARANTIFFAIIFTYVILGKTTKWLSIVACLVVVSGFVVGSVGEVEFEWAGLIFGVISSAFVALYGIFVKKVIGAVDNNHWKLLIYNTLMAIVLLFFVLFATGGVNVLMTPALWPDQATQGKILISGVFGWLINIAIFMQINYTSALTNSISGTAKACVQTLLGWLIWRNPISWMNLLGICLVIGGSGWYSRIRYLNMLEEKSRQGSQSDSK